MAVTETEMSEQMARVWSVARLNGGEGGSSPGGSRNKVKEKGMAAQSWTKSIPIVIKMTKCRKDKQVKGKII